MNICLYFGKIFSVQKAAVFMTKTKYQIVNKLLTRFCQSRIINPKPTIMIVRKIL